MGRVKKTAATVTGLGSDHPLSTSAADVVHLRWGR